MSSHFDWVSEVVARHDLKKPFSPENGEPLKFKVGDLVAYMNSEGVVFRRRVTGFYRPDVPCSIYARGARYCLNTDSPWMPVSESSLRLDC